MWIMWKKKSCQDSSAEDLEGTELLFCNANTRIFKVFNSNLTDIFLKVLRRLGAKCNFSQIKKDVEHLPIPQSDFAIDKIMHMDVVFCKLQLI